MRIPPVRLTHGIIALGFALSHAYAAELPGWKLVWSDEFDKPGAPDSAKWSYEKGSVRNNEKQYYTENRRENARVEDGKLIIEARKDCSSFSRRVKFLPALQLVVLSAATDAKEPVDARVESLLAKMTRAQKIGQLQLISINGKEF